MRTSGWILLCVTAAFAAGCSVRDPRFREETVYLNGHIASPEPSRANFDNVSYWDGDGIQGEPLIRIALAEQKAYFYKGGELVGVSAISSGREEFYTPTGRYKIIQKSKDHKSNLYGDYVDANGNVLQKDVDVKKDPKPPGAKFDGARMPYFMRVVGGIGMHEGFLPGYPASHGCIRMPGFMASAFFNNVKVGTAVEITH